MNSFIENLNLWGGNFLTFAWPMFWQSSLLIAMLFGFDFLFRRRLRASLRYALWLVVLLKLCVPPTFALPTSPAWWWHKTPPPVVAKRAPHYTVSYDNRSLPEMPQTPLPAFVPPRPAMTYAALLLMVSAIVNLALLFCLLVRWCQITRLVKRANTSHHLTALANEAQRFVGMKLKVRVKLTTNSMSPAVCGLFRPAILIPQSLAENFPDEQLRAVLLHELMHLRRRDVWVNFVQALLQIIYWWHPLVWLANAHIRRVREEAVDDAVMLALRDEAESYAPTLLEVAKLALNRPLASLGLVGILESRHALRQRIERLVDFRPPRHAGLTIVSLLGILAFTAIAVPMGDGPQTDSNTNIAGLERTSNASKQPFTSDQTLIVTEEVSSNAWKNFIRQSFSLTNKEQAILFEDFGTLLSVSVQHKSDLVPSYAIDVLLRSNSPNQKIILALRRFIEAKSSSLPLLIGALNYSHSNFWAADILGMMGTAAKPAVPTLQNALQSLDEYTRWRVAVALNKIDSDFPAPPMLATNFQKTTNGKMDAEAMAAKAKAAHLVQDAKLYYEMGKMAEAEKLLKSALLLNAQNNGAKYYLGLVQTALQHPQVAQPISGSQNIVGKLDHIRLDQFGPFNYSTLQDVIRQLNEAARQNDPEKNGVHISTATNSVSSQIADINSIFINVSKPMKNLRLADALDVMVQVADKPIKYSVMDQGVIFSLKDNSDISGLHTRQFRMETTDLMAAMRKASGTKTNNISAMTKDFFKTLGVDLDMPGKSVFFNDGMGELFVRATATDLDTIENALERFSHVAPQIHIKARFLQVSKESLALLKPFPELTNGVRIVSDASFRKLLQTLESETGTETLAEPEVVTTGGRQAQMRVTETIITVITNYKFVENITHGTASIIPESSKVEIGPVLDVVPNVLADGYTINLTITTSLIEFLGYDTPVPTNTIAAYNRAGEKINLPKILPRFYVRQAGNTLNLWDNQTAIISGLPEKDDINGKEVSHKSKPSDKELLVFVTATIVDPAGNRIHSDKAMLENIYDPVIFR